MTRPISLHNTLGVANAALRRHDPATESYKKVLKIKPNCEEAYNNMGNVLTEMGELEAAVECYKKAIEIKPDHAETYSNMGFVLKSKFELDTALYDHIAQAFKIKPVSLNKLIDKKSNRDLDAAIDSFERLSG